MHSDFISVLEQFYACEEPGGTAFVVCIDCGKRNEQRFKNLLFLTDAQVAPRFTALGWTIKPTRCPKCAKAAAKGGE